MGHDLISLLPSGKREVSRRVTGGSMGSEDARVFGRGEIAAVVRV